MKKLTRWIACYISLCFLIFACEDATVVDMSQTLSSANDYALVKRSPSSDQTIWFTFNKANLPDGKYKVGTNPKTGSKLFIILKKNEVVQIYIQTKKGLTNVLDPVHYPGGKSGEGHVEFMCEDPNVIKIFESRPDAVKPTSKLSKYTIYVVPRGCDPHSHVLLISMEKFY